MADQMAEAHAKDMRRDAWLRTLRGGLADLYEELSGERAFKISDAIDIVDEERAAIVRRWD